jgi:hypothetical protein
MPVLPVLNPILALFAAVGFTVVALFFVRVPDELLRVSSRSNAANLVVFRAIFVAVWLGPSAH